MRMTRRSGLVEMSSRSRTSKKSVLMSRSCTSSIITCEIPSNSWSLISRRSKTPVVTNSMFAASLGALPCSLTANPTEFPIGSSRSAATRSATDIAAILRGCVTMMRVFGP